MTATDYQVLPTKDSSKTDRDSDIDVETPVARAEAIHVEDGKRKQRTSNKVGVILAVLGAIVLVALSVVPYGKGHHSGVYYLRRHQNKHHKKPCHKHKHHHEHEHRGDHHHGHHGHRGGSSSSSSSDSGDFFPHHHPHGGMMGGPPPFKGMDGQGPPPRPFSGGMMDGPPRPFGGMMGGGPHGDGGMMMMRPGQFPMPPPEEEEGEELPMDGPPGEWIGNQLLDWIFGEESSDSSDSSESKDEPEPEVEPVLYDMVLPQTVAEAYGVAPEEEPEDTSAGAGADVDVKMLVDTPPVGEVERLGENP